MAVATVLLVSSLSLLGAALAAWRTRAAEQDRRLQEDAVRSVAHWLVDRLATSHRCLLAVPAEQWQPSPPACQASGADPADLLTGRVEGTATAWSYRQTRWQPAAGGEAVLQLEARTEDGHWRPGRFRVALDAAGAVLALRREGGS
jgi:hypothetical protein